MAKFIIEISDEQIREMANPDKAKEQIGGEDKMNPMMVLFNMIGASVVERELDKGVNEFHISREKMKDKQPIEFFDRNVGDICNLAMFALKDEKEEKKDE